MASKKKKTFYDIQRAQVLKERRKKLRLSVFCPQEKSISGRVCEFLLWASTKYPKSFILHAEITQAVFNLGAKPHDGSKVVKSVSGSISRARKIMKNKFKQDIVVKPGVGARATVDDLDILSTSVMRDTDKHERTASQLKQTVGLINNKKLDELIEKAPLEIRDDLKVSRDWFVEHLKKYVKVLAKPASRKALLPPLPE